MGTCLSHGPVAAQQACRARGHHINSLVHAVKVDCHLVVLADYLPITGLQVVEPSAVLCKGKGTGRLREGKQATERDTMSQAVRPSLPLTVYSSTETLRFLRFLAS